jgi:hypothetical protein
VTTLDTPWHDGVESREPAPWTRWVEQSLASLADLVDHPPPARRRRRRLGRGS